MGPLRWLGGRARRRLRLLALRRSLPGADISLRASVDRASALGAAPTIAAGVFVSESSLAANAYIGEGATVSSSKLGSHVSVRERSIVNSSRLGSHVRLLEDTTVANCELGDYVSIGPNCVLTECELGSYTYTALGCRISTTRIGRFCSVGPELLCGFGDHPTHLLTSSPVFYSTLGQCGTTFATEDAVEESTPIRIGNDVWIGARVFVRNGVTIGDGAIVAAGAVVVGDVPPYSVVGGVPAKVVRMRFDESTVEGLLDLRWWDWDEDTLRAATRAMAQSDPSRLFDWAERNLT